jgi:hypothetical protein
VHFKNRFTRKVKKPRKGRRRTEKGDKTKNIRAANNAYFNCPALPILG